MSVQVRRVATQSPRTILLHTKSKSYLSMQHGRFVHTFHICFHHILSSHHPKFNTMLTWWSRDPTMSTKTLSPPYLWSINPIVVVLVGWFLWHWCLFFGVISTLNYRFHPNKCVLNCRLWYKCNLTAGCRGPLPTSHVPVSSQKSPTKLRV
jgi:hypothetical protein